ncbi:histidine--tRNA ligase [Microcella sp.]|uniref:histidine--tRNA ligase n=1 Tax=Microcella sp. TaxID=1913979 RepID=UPI002565DC07|nr:histidine--tRNA ligase [Microcella sp.]MBX9471459.1 histidine--tRNA ligase [Microcella sp.]
MATAVTPPRGMRDFLPTEKARRERVLQRIRSVYRAHGFDEIETPVVEDSARLHAGLGGDNEKLAFAVMKRGLTMDALAEAATPLDLADLGLRFDLTVPLARFYASNRGQLPSVFRAIQIAPVWRAERPQKGRYRQFVQCDIDIIGEPGIIAEVELISATAAALEALGVPGCSIRVNDRRLLTAWLAAFEVPDALRPAALISMDKLDKIGLDGVVAELRAIGVARADDLFVGLHPALEGDESWRMLDHAVFAGSAAAADLRSLRAAAGEIPLVFDPFLVRGMGYYTGPIFEVAHPDVGYSLGGGGRYDGMIGRFLGTEVPACGFSLGFERLIDLVELGDEPDDGAALLYERDADLATVVALKNELVAEGARVRLLARPKNMKAALELLEAEGFTRFAVVSTDAVAEAAALDWRRLNDR